MATDSGILARRAPWTEPNLRRATCSSVARALCTLPSAQPWGSVGAAGACGAPGTLGAVGGARGCLPGGRCTEGWVRHLGGMASDRISYMELYKELPSLCSTFPFLMS